MRRSFPILGSALLLVVATAPVLADDGLELKGHDETPSLALPETTGGPDGFGYYFIDSLEPGGPVFGFADISGTGTALNLTDDGEANVTLSFNFPFYGVNYTGVRVGNNGGLLLGVATGDVFAGNICPLPSTSGSTAPRVSVFWDDIDSDTGNVYHQEFANCPATGGGSGQCWIVQWHDRPHFSNSADHTTFQAVLYASGNILYQYLDTDFSNAAWDFGASASVGIEDEAQSASFFLQYSCNQVNSIPNGLAILWTTTPPGCMVTLACPADQLASAPPGAQSTTVTYPAPTVGGTCTNPAVVCVPASGDPFPVGTTTVVCTATEGNAAATCTFDVTVGTGAIQEIPTASVLGLVALALLLAGAAFLVLRRAS